jgi:hypothetical protein
MECVVITLNSTDGLLNRAFHLSSFIVGDREAALRIVTGALAKLQVAITTQGKRLYYTPTGRHWSRSARSDHSRNSISFSELHLLQRLIYIESEPYEIALEQGKGSTPVSEEDLVIHFVKHLTKKTIKRNSFYVTLGLSRVLHSYTTVQTMDIYNAVIQDPERVKDDYYYRSRKGVLMQELKQRFGDLINICRGPRGEERFQADDNPHRFVQLVRQCLDFFTPWHTPCLVPAGADPIRDGIPSLSALSRDDENKVEVNRIHAVLHPDCFSRLTAGLRFDAPETRLEIPRFFYSNRTSDNGSNGTRHNLPKLNEEELTSIKEQLEGNAARRKAAPASLLRIIVDGTEYALIDLRETRTVRFSLENDAELLEVRSRDKAGEDLLLASHLLPSIEGHNGIEIGKASIILEGGQKIVVCTSLDMSGTNSIVEVKYRETNAFRAASLLLDQISRLFRNGLSRGVFKQRWIYASLVSGVLLAIALGLVFKYARTENPGVIAYNQQVSERNGAVKPGEIVPTSPASNTSGTSSADEKNAPNSSNTSPEQLAKSESPVTQKSARFSAQEKRPDTRTPESQAEREGNTRSVVPLPSTLSLAAVKKVHVEIEGDEALAKNLREMVTKRLQADNRISLALNRDEADGLLKVILIKGAGTEPDRANVELINARGDVIWPNSQARGKYSGSPARMSANIVRDMLLAIQKSAKRR